LKSFTDRFTLNQNNFDKDGKHFMLIKQLKNKDCFYLNSDKGNSIVMLWKQIYFDRVFKMISDE